MKLDRRRFLGSSVGVAATAGMTAEWVWPRHSVSYRRPRSSVAVLNAAEYSESLILVSKTLFETTFGAPGEWSGGNWVKWYATREGLLLEGRLGFTTSAGRFAIHRPQWR
jgi:hypothetical protein